jgi:hypothetical protein
VVKVSGIVSRSTLNWGEPAGQFSAKRVSVTVDFNKLLLNKYTQDHNEITIKVGDPGAVYGTNWYWKNTRQYIEDHDPIIPFSDTFSDNYLSLGYSDDSDKIDRIPDALGYFVQNFCSGKRSAF